MAKRVLCHLGTNTGLSQPALFHQCLVNTLQGHPDSATVSVKCHLEDDKLFLSKAGEDEADDDASATLMHPPMCPSMMMSAQDVADLPPDISSRGINVGVVALVESSDNRVLITRRAPHMRTFPGVWVPPGGGVDCKESLVQAVVRELREETGIVCNDPHVVDRSSCRDSCERQGSLLPAAERRRDRIHVLCLWESVYPPFLEWGPPSRHHVVIYYHVRMDEDHSVLNSKMTLQREEVDASAWLTQRQVDLVVNGGEEPLPTGMEKTFLMTLVKEDGTEEEVQAPAEILWAKADRSGGEVTGRVSSGTRFALDQWMQKCTGTTGAKSCKL